MTQINCTQVTEFILVGLTDRQEVKIPLFVLLLSIYLFTVVGNLGLILVIRMDARLHTPMYFFLSNLAFVDFCYASVITPKMLENFLYQQKVITFNACAAQLGCFLACMTAECLLLASMAYDLYLVAAPYSYSFLVTLFHNILTFRLSYCHSNILNHFYCDDMPLLRLTCSDTHTKQLWIFVCAGIMFISSLLVVFVSYVYIISAILRMRSAEGRRKAFSTCSSHILAVTIFYGSLIFMYLQPSSHHSLDTDKMAFVFYTVIIPMLNPLIYSLRNKEVKDALKKAIINGNQVFMFMKLRKVEVIMSRGRTILNNFEAYTYTTLQKVDDNYASIGRVSLRHVPMPLPTVCCFITFVVCEQYLLSVIAYDRYVAICSPLLYVILMPKKLCNRIIASMYVYGFSVGLVQTVATFQLSFCGSNMVNHFYCDDVPLVALACSDTQVKELMLLVIAGFNTLCSLLVVIISCVFILLAILRIHSAEGSQKAFSTCASHLTSITIFYGTIIFMYLLPKSSHSLNTDKFALVFYVVVIPMLNPLIYSLKNQEVKSALKKITEKLCLAVK
ncbi:Olfactory receptor 1044 [Camelus dromedarius]|uniref:Olfactory receptor 1044 n=1 Tax=Camelus dromedarius TaxID=9838 RepID=A0A5N4DKX5_CAMDR|nr:Olfactory receptor 1044 [Camelus dromedarius]